MNAPKLAVFPKGFFDDLISGKLTLGKWLDLAATLGVDGIEMYPAFLPSRRSADLRAVKVNAAARGLAIPMMCHSPDFTQPHPEDREREAADTREVITATGALGGTFCRVLSGQNRPGLVAAQAMQWVIDGIRAVLPAAKEAGVTLVLENHYKDGRWDYPEFAQSRERYLAILNAVPELAAQYDPSNAVVAGEDPYRLLSDVLPRVATMHASDRYLEGGTPADLAKRSADPMHGYAKILKHGVIGGGFNDFDRIFTALAGAGFSGWVSIEDGDGPTLEAGMANLKASADFLRTKMKTHFGAGARA